MKKNAISRSIKIASAIIACSICSFTISFAQVMKEKPGKVSLQEQVSNANQQETNQFIQRLMDDRLVDEGKGFVVEKKQNKLYLNGQQQTVEISNKYLSTIKQEQIRVVVYSLQERLRMHPEINIMQILAPISFSSPCVDNKPAKPGC